VEQTGWMSVHRLPRVPVALVNRVVNFPYFFNPFWIRAIWREARAKKADCLIVADLPLAPTAVWVGSWLGIPVHYDMAEIYPEFIRSQWEFEDMGWSDYLVRNPRLADLVERYVLHRVRTVFVVGEESRSRCLSLGVATERLVVIGNTPPDEQVHQPAPPFPAVLEPWRDRLRVLFVGILIGDRGVCEAVEAMAMVREVHPTSVLILAGDGPDVPRIQATITRLGLGQQVALLGWQQHDTLPALYAHSHLGLLPFRDGRHVRLTLANKLFDYMSAGLPCVAADLPSMRRVLEETGAGVLHPPSDVPKMAAAIADLLGDPARRHSLGENGRRAAQEVYRWGRDEERLLAAIEPGRGR
jgi:glycosyltransferase involved in cell wall biosynthesis